MKNATSVTGQTLTGKLSIGKMMARSTMVLLLCFMYVSGFATTYYYQSGTYTTASSWNTSASGTGTAATVFTNSSDVWVVRTALTLNATWTVAGQLWIGDGTTANTVTITTNPTVTGGILVKAGATLLQNAASTATSPVMATVQNAASTINYGSNTSHVLPLITFGYLTLSGTGTTSFTAGTTNIAADFNQTSGALILNTAAVTSNVNVSGNCSLTGGSIDFCNASASGTYSNLNLAKNLTISGTYSVTTSGGVNNGAFVFNGAGTAAAPQVFTISNGGTLVWTNIVVNSGTYVQLAGTSTTITMTGSTNLSPDYRGSIIVSGTLDTKVSAFVASGASSVFTVNNGATLITQQANGLGGASAGVVGSSNWTNSFSGSANYIFNGTAAQITGTNLPATIATGGSVTVNNSNGVTLSQATTFSSGSAINLVSGTFTNTAGNLVMNSGSAVNRDNGSLAATPTTYSGVNLTFNNLGNNMLTVTAGNEWPAAFTGSVTINKPGATITLNGTKAVTGGITLTAGVLDVSASNYGISLTGNWINASGATSFTARAGLVTLNGTAAQTAGGTYSTNFNSLTLNNSTGCVFTTDQVVNGTLTLTSGQMNIGANNLFLGASTPAVSGTFSSTTMIIANGGGQVKKQYTANGAYLFPVGDNTPIYSPITLNVSGSAYASAYVAVKVTKAKQPANANSNNYLNRYWSVATSGITSPSYSVSGATYATADVTGTESTISGGQYSGTTPWSKFGATNAVTHTFTTTAVTSSNSDFTGISTAGPVVTAGANTAICAGTSTPLSVNTFTADPTATYSWAPSATLASSTGSPVTATPTVTTTYTLTITDGNGFTGTATETVTVNALPAAISGPGTVCAGSTVTLTEVGGGVWSSSDVSVAKIGSSTGIVTGVTPGTATITFTNLSGCKSTVVITVNALPALNAGSSVAICSGSSATLIAAGAATYAWTPGAGLSATTGTTVSASPASTTIYSVTGTNTFGCASSATVTVTINALPVVTVGPGYAICSGSTSPAITATGGTTYSWLPATGLSSYTTVSVVANPLSTTTYTVTGTNAGGCSNTATVTVTVNPLPAIVAGSGTSVCTGSSTTVSATGGTSYSWAPATALSATTGTSVTAAPTVTTTYTVTGTNANGCVNTATEVVTVNPLPSVGAGAASAICSGGSTTINANGTVTYTWAPSTGLSATTGSLVNANPTTTTTYTVTGHDANGCVKTAQATVTVNPLPTVTAGPGYAVCPGGTTPAITATGAATYAWTPASGLSATSGASVTAAPSVTTTYTVTGTNGAGCSNTASVTVTVNAVPVIGAGSGTSICNGASTTLSATGGVSYSWSPAGSLVASTGASVSAHPSATTTYTVTGVNASGCSAQASVTVTVNLLTIGVSSGTSVCAGSAATLTATGGVSYSWSPSIGLSATTGASVSASPAATINYTVTGSNGAGCSNAATVTVTVHALPSIVAPPSVVLCNAYATSIVASGGVSYHWAPATGLSATTGATVVASPSSAIVYTVTGTLGSGCSNTATVSVTVNPSPLMTSAGNGGAICAGSTLTLNSAATGGTGVIAYSWAGPNAFSSAAQNPSIASATTLASGVYTITATDANGCVATGASTTTASVNPMPSAGTITGAGAVCVGNTAALSNSATGGVWSANMGFAAVGSSTGVVSGLAVGALTISYTVTNIYGCTAYTTKAMNVTPAPGNIYTYAGTGTNANTGDGGPAYLASMQGPRDIAVDNAGNVYFTDVTANVIRKIDVNGMISKVAGNGSTGNGGDGGPATAASLSQPLGIYVDSAANIYFSNTNSHTIRKISASTGIITTIAGVAGTSGSAGDGGPATAATFNAPMGLTMDASGNLYIADQLNYKVRKIDAATGLISTIAGTGSYSYSGDGGPGTAARLSLTRGVTLDNSGNLYIVDGPNGVIRKLVLSTGIISTFAGTGGVLGSAGDGGPASAATFNTPSRVIFDGSNVLYVTDLSNNKVRQINLATGIVSAVVGTGGTGFSGDGGAAVLSHVYQPYGVACDKAGRMYVTDAANRRVRLASVSGSITISVAGSTTVSSGTPVTFTAAASMTGSGVSLQWQKNGVNTGSGSSSYTNASPASGDVYRCIMTITPECGVAYSDTSNSITILVSGARQADTTTAVSELNSQETIKIYPNPVHGQLTVEGTGLENGQMQISVLDQMGRVVTSRTESVDNGSITTAIDMQGYPAGMYIVMLTDNAGKSRVMKCIKN